MAVRGRKPLPSQLRRIAGRRARPSDEPTLEARPRKPTWLTGRGAEMWDEVLTFAHWLTVADSYKLAAWCDRQSEFESARTRHSWTASDRREHRTAGSELGLDPSSRVT
jgi:phage terminase small subunit